MGEKRVTGRDRPSMHEVAKAAGVSTSTVSRFLSGKLNLALGTETRITEAMKSVGYQRTPERRSPAAAKTIAIVTPQVDIAYFGELAEHAVEAAQRNDLRSVLLTMSRGVSGVATLLDLVQSQTISGVIYAGFSQENPLIETIREMGVPIVAVAESLPDLAVDTVRADHASAARQGVAYLASMGHRRVALIAGPQWLRSSRATRDGFIDAMSSSGLDAAPELQLFGEINRDFGYAACSQLLLTADRPTAIYAAADEFALGMYSAARDLGIEVPDDLSIVGSDDISYASFLSPPLSSVRQPRDRIADSAVRLLVRRMEFGMPSDPVDLVLPVSLQVRQSVRQLTTAEAKG